MKALRALPTLSILSTVWCLATAGAATTRYVWQDSPSPAPPYTGWTTAAHDIQNAVDAALAGDTVLVAGGVYATGGRAVYGSMTNRVAIDRAITVESLMGPEVTIIQGYQVPGTTNGDGAVRCVYLTNGAALSGFTLTDGATRSAGDGSQEQTGGGVWCQSTNALVTNCIVAGNSASSWGGGAHQGTLNSCTITGNSAQLGGGAYEGPNDPADAARIRRAGAELTREVVMLDHQQCHMREVGTAHLTEIMDDYDLLPCNNYRYGADPQTRKIASDKFKAVFTQGMADGCSLGCDMACAKAVEGHVLRTGPDRGKTVLVDGPEYETVWCCGSNLGIFEPWAIVEINYYCDQYGLDTISFCTIMAFVMECYEAGVLDRGRTGGLDLSPGSIDGTLEVLHQMARGEGFGVEVGQGVRWLKRKWVKELGADQRFLADIGMEVKGPFCLCRVRMNLGCPDSVVIGAYQCSRARCSRNLLPFAMRRVGLRTPRSLASPS